MKNTNTRRFYAVFSKEGLGVYTSEYSMVMHSDYFGDYTSESFEYADDAIEYAITSYNKLVRPIPGYKGYRSSNISKLNWFYRSVCLNAEEYLYNY